MSLAHRSERLSRREAIARSFASAVFASKSSLRGLAKCAGVSETKVHKLVSADHGLTLDFVATLPDDVFDRVIGDVVGARGRGLHVVIQSTRSFMKAMRELLASQPEELVAAVLDATANGKLTAEQAAIIKPIAKRVSANAEAIIELCTRAELEREVILVEDET